MALLSSHIRIPHVNVKSQVIFQEIYSVQIKHTSLAKFICALLGFI